MTDLHTANEEKNQSRAFLESIIENVPVAIVVKEANSLRFVLVNRCAETLMGVARDRIIGKNVSELLCPEAAARLTKDERDVFASKNGSTVEHRIQTPGMGERFVRVVRSPILDESGECKYLSSVIDDLTERRHNERALAHANKMEAISSLTGGVAHDFNNLLLVMIGNLDLLIEELSIFPSSREKAEIVLDACLRGADLTKQMLTFSRKQSLQPKDVDINSLLRRTAQFLLRTIGEQIALRLDVPQGEFVSHIDEGQLQAAVINVVVNARDAMPEGGDLKIASQAVRLEKERDGMAAGRYAMIQITDTGHGMNEQVLSRIFEPYFSTKDHGKGTGLGLSMVYGFVRQSGGGITASSIPGRGSTITLYLPLAAGTRAASTINRSEQQQPAIDHSIGKTILVVDDNDASRNTVLRQLRQLGFAALEAADADAALALIASSGDIDLLLTDVMMPRTDGKVLAKLARGFRPGIAVLLMSGFPDAVSQTAPGEEASIIAKPFRKGDLKAAIFRALEDKREEAA
jgi:PAS domain S-box-containing protein